MGNSSIQVTEETRERLKRYKSEGMSYEDVLKVMMELIEPEEFQTLYAKWQKRVWSEVRKSKKWSSLDL